ncbi:MAG: hypothetical protein J0J06_01550 [Sphingomonas sp.]|jgi:hypothetical protein|uniref:hypothetical protein n=1 Tax=Sphingomonas sp. TaxID=28214 RepID=UPI001AC95F7C|nr:hypothetical protein [Sphingomonas sp.]MBN8814115.1 hypothetical protein [Sphingomonas sp.]
MIAANELDAVLRRSKELYDRQTRIDARAATMARAIDEGNWDATEYRYIENAYTALGVDLAELLEELGRLTSNDDSMAVTE